MTYIVCPPETQNHKPIYFSIDTINIDLASFLVPEYVLEVVSGVNYLKLFCESDKYQKKGGDGSYLENTSTGSVFITRTYRGGFDATFDYTEHEIVRLLEAIADNTRKTKNFITVLDYVGRSYSSTTFTTRVGIILPSSIKYAGITKNANTGKDVIPNGFSLSFVNKDNIYIG